MKLCKRIEYTGLAMLYKNIHETVIRKMKLESLRELCNKGVYSKQVWFLQNVHIFRLFLGKGDELYVNMKHQLYDHPRSLDELFKSKNSKIIDTLYMILYNEDFHFK